ncbi:MAG: S26 family signal peptidase, partial [Thermoplasmata archaeon]
MVKKDSLNSIRALLIVIIAIALIFIALFAYSGIWPPVVIIESSSMQHGSQWQYGVINTGDMVIVKKVTSVSDIITYVQGRETGYKSYGDYGNVIIYTSQSGMSIIHRAIFYVASWNNTVPEIIGEQK